MKTIRYQRLKRFKNDLEIEPSAKAGRRMSLRALSVSDIDENVSPLNNENNKEIVMVLNTEEVSYMELQVADTVHRSGRRHRDTESVASLPCRHGDRRHE